VDSRYTLRNRRSPELRSDLDRRDRGTRFAAGDLEAAPAIPSVPPRPFGELSRTSIEALVKLAETVMGAQDSSSRQKRRSGTQRLLEILDGFDGPTWQDRWEASGLNERGRPVSRLSDNKYHGYNLVTGLKVLCCLRVIQPSLVAFRSNKFNRYAPAFLATQQDPLLAKFFDEVTQTRAPHKHQYAAQFDVSCALTTQGITLADLTPEALLFYANECRRHGLVVGTVAGGTKFAGQLAWDVLFNMGHFPPSTPPTLRTYIYKGQRTVEEMIDYYEIKSPEVRRLLIDYITRRKADTDYNTQEGLARNLAGNFWSKIEQIAPDQKDLHLSDEIYQQWREAVRYRQDGKPRADVGGTVLLPVRALYMDLQSWALEEPERWAHWAVPCPIPPNDLRGFAQRRRRINDRMADRIRQRQPLLPTLVAKVEDHYTSVRDLLAVARSAPLGGHFTHRGRSYQRTNGRNDRRSYDDPIHAAVRVTDLATGTVRHLVLEEETAFWEWAYLEVLRQTGIRVEELVELTHMSVRQYQRPSGEVIALLVIAPSKTDRERVIPMSAELFHVIATIIRRHTAHGPIPLLPRYDGHERLWVAPMPYLFQRQIGAVRRVTGTGTVNHTLRRRCQSIAETDPAFQGLHFTPHDFRRLFATDLVNNGLPIHIGAALLGHLNLQTTRGYVAVFEEDVTRHYQDFLARRRELRPAEEYRPATTEEMTEFEEHFDKRKVELGSCGRPYGTPCQHEHACIRCPMLHINPKMLPRLQELEEDLHLRRRRAVAEGWLGEIEGIDLTLRFLSDKHEQADRLTKITRQVDLGMPSPRSRS
jgi:integrase